MSTSISDVMSALEQLLLEHFKSINTGATTQPFLAFELGTPIPDATFRNPADTTKYSPALALEYLSHRANAVPSIQEHMFIETSNTVEDLYQILLAGSTPVDVASMELLGAIKRSAQSAFDVVLQTESGISEQYRPTYGDPQDWYDLSIEENWARIVVDRKDEPVTSDTTPAQPSNAYSRKLLQWSVAPVEFRSQLGLPASDLSVSTITAMRAATMSHTEVRAMPTEFRAAAATKFALKTAPLSTKVVAVNPAFAAAIAQTQYHRRVSFPPPGIDTADIPPPPPPVAPSPPPEVSSDGFLIDVRVSIIKLRRPWLSDGLLNLKNWFVPSVPKGSFSDGTGAENTGILPVLPVACVLIRDLAIHAKWSEDDQQNLENSTHLGAFGLQGRSYDKNSATLTIPGMQSVAWICDPLPVLPPADVPAP